MDAPDESKKKFEMQFETISEENSVLQKLIIQLKENAVELEEVKKKVYCLNKYYQIIKENMQRIEHNHKVFR